MLKKRLKITQRLTEGDGIRIDGLHIKFNKVVDATETLFLSVAGIDMELSFTEDDGFQILVDGKHDVGETLTAATDYWEEIEE